MDRRSTSTALPANERGCASPLLVIKGDSDDHTPLPDVQECITAAQAAYRAAKVEDHFAVRIQEKTGHKVKPEAEREAIEWFVKWLKP